MAPHPMRSLLAASLICAVVGAGLVPSVAPVRAATPQIVDDFESGLPSGVDGNGVAVGFVTFNDFNSTVAISTTATPPAPVPGAVDGNHVLKMDVNVVSYAGFVHNFQNASSDAWVSQDWSSYEGISFWLYGNDSGTSLFVDVLDNRNPGSTKDDAERWSTDLKDDFSGWKQVEIPFASLHRKEIGNGAPNDGLGLTEVHGWALGSITTPSPQTYYVDDAAVYGVAPIRPLTVGFSALDYSVTEGATATVTAKLSKPSADPVTVHYASTIATAVAGRDYTPVSGTLTFAPNVTQRSFSVATIDDAKYQGTRAVQVELSDPTGGASIGLPPVASVTILDNEAYDPTLVDDFETQPLRWTPDKKTALTNPEIASGSPLAVPGQGAYEHVLQAAPKSGVSALAFSRAFATGQDWSNAGGLDLWYFGQDSGKKIQVSLTNDQAPATSPSQWGLVWSDEFNAASGAAPNAATWGREIGDGTIYGIPGWGNDELEYYTDGTANAAMDGSGHLVITTKAADGTQSCYYGPCRYTSARLLTKNRFEVAYGRVEARVKVPSGAGLWPAFWMLGSNIDQVSWPQAGEIDIMENVGRLPDQVFGTLHGPGYSGGQSYGGSLDLGQPVSDGFHTFAVEWQPDRITWLLDGSPYFTATPGDAFLQGKQWVFNHPFYMLLNVAVGGNFGGAVGPDTTFPQQTKVDYVRLYQGTPSPKTFAASFRDDFTGWHKITVPFSAFLAADGSAPDLTRITAVNVHVPGGQSAPVRMDELRLTCPDAVTVTTAADDGPGSLRGALASVCAGGSIGFAPGLAGQTITNLSALTVGKKVTIDGAGAPGLTISGGDTNRVLEVAATATATVRNLTLAHGYGYQLGGGVLNNGNLTLDHVVLRDNAMGTTAGDFWQGGGGIYNGDGATLDLVDSTVAGNAAAWSGGGVYSFFHTTTTIVRSTISGNTSNDVGGGIRSLGNVTIANSTISGNTATGWHGGAIFQTDGDVTISNSTIADNIAPDWGSSTLFIGQYGGSFVPTLTLTNTIISGNHWYACERYASGGATSVVSGGHNLVQDSSCSAVASDIVNGAAGLGQLADNGGPTWTHALLAGSPAIDAADPAASVSTDQRGVARPQGAGPDIGAYEAQ